MGGEEWDGVMISVVEWVWGRGSLWGRGDVAMGTGDVLFFFFSAAWSAPVGTGHISDVALPWTGAIPGVRAAGDGVSHAES